MKLIAILLLMLSIAQASDEILSLDAVTAIAKAQISKDGLGDKKFKVQPMGSRDGHAVFYYVKFDPLIPDPAGIDDKRFIGYIIDLKGNIRKIQVSRMKFQHSTLGVSSLTFMTTHS